MYDEIIENIKTQLSPNELENIKQSTIHLGVFTEPYLTFMLDGKKTIESRFSKNRILPFEHIGKSDIVFLKKSSGNVVGYMTIRDILFIDLTKTSLEEIKHKYGNRLCVDESFWQAKRDSKYATLLFIDKITKLAPFHVTKKGMQTWLIVKKKK